MREGNALRAPGDRSTRLTSRSSAREWLPKCHWPGYSSEVLYQIGMPPSRIDIMTSVTGLDFDAAWPNRVMVTFGDVESPVLGLDDMRTAKRVAGRLKDLADLEELG